MLATPILAAAMAFSSVNAQKALGTAGELVAKHPMRDAGTIQMRFAASFVRDKANGAGLDAEIDSFTADSPDGPLRFHNVMGELPAHDPSASWIILITHYDTAPGIGGGFQGANDGASTTGLLIELARQAKRAGIEWRTHPILFAWVDGEECKYSYTDNDGLQGSKRVLEYMRSKKRRIFAVINLDMLGARNLHITVPPNSTASLADAVIKAAQRAGYENKITISKKKSHYLIDDFLPFLNANCNAVALIDMEYGTKPGLNDIWHTPADTIDKLSAESLEISGKIITELLNLLQQKPTGKSKKR